jgi:ubiquitin-like 1-activating enzyme E1 B
VLIVGAGGIGCEILKNLAMIGCKEIDLIDLDTIDVSNLNRQFLFRPEHVGQPKAVIAAKAAETFNPDIKVNAFHDNIKSARFNTSYFSRFDVVLNALDNLDARRHVNRLCLAAKVPLFDAGTTGYLGQVMPIVKGLTACYECFPKPSPKVYPICTIRSTPDKPVHCIVWAKECFKLVFARPSDSMLFEDESATDDKSEYMHLITFPSNKSLDNLLLYAKELAIGLFHRETQKKIDMDVYKTAAKIPEPTDLTLIEAAVADAKRIVESNPTTWKYDRYETPGVNWEQKVSSLQVVLVDFILCLVEIGFNDETSSLIGQLSFDKDDFWAMRFVVACANIRSAIFSIPILSFHDCKGIAGNIIPAIATTNAIVSGAQVALALKCLAQFERNELYETASRIQESNAQGKQHETLDKIRRVFPHTYCVRLPNRRGYFLQPSVPDEPVPSCYVCGTSQMTLTVDTSVFTLKELVSKVLKGKLGFNEPAISQGSNILYEEGDGADEDLAENLPLSLDTCPGGGIRDGTMLDISDFTQNLELSLLVMHCSNTEFEAIINEQQEKQKQSGGAAGALSSLAVDMFILEGEQALATRKAAESQQAGTVAAEADKSAAPLDTTGDDDFMIIDEAQYESDKVKQHEEVPSVLGKKRGRDDNEILVVDMDDDDTNGAKRAKAN